MLFPPAIRAGLQHFNPLANEAANEIIGVSKSAVRAEKPASHTTLAELEVVSKNMADRLRDGSLRGSTGI